MTRPSILLSLLLLAGCGSSHEGGADGGMDAGAPPGADAGSSDAGDVDAGAPGADSGIDCSTIGCGAPIFCGEPCTAACGCCDCGGESFCADDDLVTCDGGCYERTPCGPGGCVESSTGASCAGGGTCADLEAEYEALVGVTASMCGAPGECHIVYGHCGVGLGGCHYALNVSTTQEALNDLASRWTAMGCDAGRPVCDCPMPPEDVRCDAGGCLAR